MILTIRNMVCDRCIRVVREELGKLGLDVRSVVLGEAVIAPGQHQLDLERIRSVLRSAGFDIVDDRKAKIVEKIKTAVIRLIHHNEKTKQIEINFSEYLAEEVNADYHHISSLFSSIEGITIEKYVILQKIERVKELLKYGELTLSEIAYQMEYSSVAHLSSQFKKVTGMTPTAFKKMTLPGRKSIDLL
ncbi:helix-turn-helix transcriptional regulator [bacterium]|nr:helix-turn-helix transcriptional regulator [bacterium]